MEAANTSSPLGKIIPVLLIFAGLIALYYLYMYLFGPKSTNAYTIISKTQSASIDPSKPITITSDKLPSIYEGGQFTVSTWIYISNWSYRAGFNKSILSIGGPNFDIIRVYLGGYKPSLSVRLHTREASSMNNTVPSGATGLNINIGGMSSSPSTANGTSLDKATQNATFNILQPDSGLLDSSQMCDLPDIDLQRWVNITVSVDGKTTDVYLDGKLSRSCVLPSFFKVDAGGYSANLLSYGGFGGQISTTAVYDAALNPEEVYKNYMAGPEPITSFTGWIGSLFSSGPDTAVTPTK